MAQAKQKIRESEPFWWKFLSISSAMAGILYFLDMQSSDNYGAIAGLVFNLIFAIGLWNQSLLMFKIYRIIMVLSLFLIVLGSMGGIYEGVDISYFGAVQIVTILVNIVTVVSLVALWIQLKKEKKIKW